MELIRTWIRWERTYEIGGPDLHPVAHYHQATSFAEPRPDTATKYFERFEFASDRFVVVVRPPRKYHWNLKSQNRLQVRQRSKFPSRTNCVPWAPTRMVAEASR